MLFCVGSKCVAGLCWQQVSRWSVLAASVSRWPVLAASVSRWPVLAASVSRWPVLLCVVLTLPIQRPFNEVSASPLDGIPALVLRCLGTLGVHQVIVLFLPLRNETRCTATLINGRMRHSYY